MDVSSIIIIYPAGIFIIKKEKKSILKALSCFIY